MNRKGIAEIPNAIISIVACLIAVGIGIGGFILLKGKGSKIDSLAFDKDTYEVAVGGTLQLNVKINPSDATDEVLTWTSDNDNVSVNNKGLVTGNSGGNATVIVSTDSGKTARCVVIVTGSGPITPTPTSNPTPTPTNTPTSTPTATPTQSGGKVDSKYVKVSTTSLSVKNGSTAKFDIIMSNAAGAISIKSSDPSIADVSTTQEFMDSTSESSKDTKTVTVTGKKAGTATITVTLSDVATYDNVKTLTGSYTITVNVK